MSTGTSEVRPRPAREHKGKALFDYKTLKARTRSFLLEVEILDSGPLNFGAKRNWYSI
jgi:hypothetical protein